MRIGSRQILSLSFITALLFVVNSCSLTKGREIGEQAVVRFHNQFNAGQYHEIYAQSDEGFEKAQAKQTR